MVADVCVLPRRIIGLPGLGQKERTAAFRQFNLSHFKMRSHTVERGHRERGLSLETSQTWIRKHVQCASNIMEHRPETPPLFQIWMREALRFQSFITTVTFHV